MRRQKQVTSLQKLIKPYGLTIIDGKHRKVVNEVGAVIYHMSSSPSCEYFADNSLSDLIKLGALPVALKGFRFH